MPTIQSLSSLKRTGFEGLVAIDIEERERERERERESN